MSAPLRQGMWSWKHGDKCRWCGTSGKTGRNKHKGVGLCFRCFDDYRKRKPKRQQQLKNQGRKWYLEKGRTPEEKKKSYERTLKYQQTPKYKKRLKTYIYERRRFIYFIRNQKKFYKRHNGIEIIIDGKIVKTPIIPVSCLDSDNNKLILKIKLFKEVYKKYHKEREG